MSATPLHIKQFALIGDETIEVENLTLVTKSDGFRIEATLKDPESAPSLESVSTIRFQTLYTESGTATGALVSIDFAVTQLVRLDVKELVGKSLTLEGLAFHFERTERWTTR